MLKVILVSSFSLRFTFDIAGTLCGVLSCGGSCLHRVEAYSEIVQSQFGTSTPTSKMRLGSVIYKALQLHLFLSKECPLLVSRETCYPQFEGIPRLTGEDTRTTRREEGKQVDQHHSFFNRC